MSLKRFSESISESYLTEIKKHSTIRRELLKLSSFSTSCYWNALELDIE